VGRTHRGVGRAAVSARAARAVARPGRRATGVSRQPTLRHPSGGAGTRGRDSGRRLAPAAGTLRRSGQNDGLMPMVEMKIAPERRTRGWGMTSSLRARLVRLERVRPPIWEFPAIVAVDNHGVILDDGHALTVPWVGRPVAELLAAVPPNCRVPP